jgi:hypothetical protein
MREETRAGDSLAGKAEKNGTNEDNPRQQSCPLDVDAVSQTQETDALWAGRIVVFVEIFCVVGPSPSLATKHFNHLEQNRVWVRFRLGTSHAAARSIAKKLFRASWVFTSRTSIPSGLRNCSLFVYVRSRVLGAEHANSRLSPK